MSVNDLLVMILNDALGTVQSSQVKFTYIIGNNGTGKSILLRKVAELATKESEIKRIQCVTSTVYDKFFDLKDEKIKYLGLRNVSNAIFFSSITRQIAKSIISNQKCLNVISNQLGQKFKIKFKKSKNPNSLSYTDKRKSRGNKVIFSDSEIKYMDDILDVDIDPVDISAQERDVIRRYLDLNPNNCELKVGKPNGFYSYDFLSSGEQNRLLTAIKIISNLENNSLVIIDEPEISLHLHWQQEYHAFLKKMISGHSGVHFIIATHSPIIVSEAYKHEDSQAVVILDSEGFGGGSFEYLDVVKGSESYDSVVLDFFSTSTYKSSTVEERIASILSGGNIVNDPIKVISDLEKLNKILPKNDEKKRLIYEAINLVHKLKEKNSNETIS